ncbi:MAG: lipopolysaccharide biosynthesis protein [Candidatus Electrothrix sp. ATG1]|nr:lipopolysaccharide biosynthesis protein [Candidatus Electrothrix sp. ATG1]
MSIEQRAFQGASWLAIFKAIGQIVSWAATVIVARILVPDDYGLMSMATVLTGYAALFSELGLGAAIIQREGITEENLASVYWFGVAFSILLGAFAFVIAWPTALLFDNKDVVPITRATSILFFIAGLEIVPLSMLKKELAFKKIGYIEMTATIVSCISMVIIAAAGFGVWTLLIGNIIRSLIKVILLYSITGWRPLFHFELNEAISFIKFGVTVAVGNSLFYVYSRSDKFFAGRNLGVADLGYYSFAQQLASIPTEKIVTIINQISFPAFSKLQEDREKFNQFYLSIIKITSVVVLPIFAAGFCLGSDFVRLLLSDKWVAIIPLFQCFCLIRIFTSISAVNNFVHTARGNPYLSMWFNAWMAFSMPLAFAFSVKYGVNGMLIPWFTIYVLSCVVWILITLSLIGLDISSFMSKIIHPIIATSTMSILLLSLNRLNLFNSQEFLGMLFALVVKLLAGATYYFCYIYLFDKEVWFSLKKNVLRRSVG